MWSSIVGDDGVWICETICHCSELGGVCVVVGRLWREAISVLGLRLVDDLRLQLPSQTQTTTFDDQLDEV